MPQFRGFPKEGLQFLRDLEKHNDREWFHARKSVYEEQVKAPMVELTLALGDEFERFAPEFLTDPKKTIYRIYRDTRFTNDKRPYKTHIAASFTHKALARHSSACFYFHISPKEILAGGGVYAPGPGELLAVRRHIAADPAAYQKIASAKAFRQRFGEVTGDKLARPPKGFAMNDPAIEILKRKQFLAGQTLDPELALSPKLLTELSKCFRTLAPFVEYLNQPLQA